MHHCDGERKLKEETALRLLDEETPVEENGNSLKSQEAYMGMRLKSCFQNMGSAKKYKVLGIYVKETSFIPNN